MPAEQGWCRYLLSCLRHDRLLRFRKLQESPDGVPNPDQSATPRTATFCQRFHVRRQIYRKRSHPMLESVAQMAAVGIPEPASDATAVNWGAGVSRARGCVVRLTDQRLRGTGHGSGCSGSAKRRRCPR